MQAIRLSLQHGIGPATATNYAAYGMILGGVVGDIERGANIGALASRLQERTVRGFYKIRPMFLLHTHIQIWTAPLRNVLEPLRHDSMFAMEMGDMEFAANAATTYCAYAFFAGRELSDLEQETADSHAMIRHMQHPSAGHLLKVFWQALHNLRGKALLPQSLQGAICDERQMQEFHRMSHDRLLMFSLFTLKFYINYLFRDYRNAFENAIIAKRYVNTMVGHYSSAIFCFYDSLVRLGMLKESSSMERIGLMREVKKNQKKLRKWADHAPCNFLNKWYLVEAEAARVGGKPLEAIDCYEQAIRLAKENSFVQEEALAKELAGEFYLARGQESSAKYYLREAQHDYGRWGAEAKVHDLATRYPQWLQEQEPSPNPFSHLNKTISITTSVTSLANSGALDFATVMKASQALSQEIVLERLLKRLMQVAVENAGAQRGMLLLKKEARWTIEAEKESDQAEAAVLQSIDIETTERQALQLPLNLIHYVAHTRTSMVIHEAVEEKLLESDPYVQHRRPRSLLAVPILHHGELTGILYLENNAVSGAFTEKRLEVLHLLASQTAISIENARLYADMEQRVAARTAELKALTLRDTLTGLANRKAFDERLLEELARARRSGQPLSLLIIDIDHFKRVNDAYGHLIGDECLRQMGLTLTATVQRMGDFIARYGGEEFVLILPDTDLAGAILFAEGLLQAVRNIVLEVGEVRHPITASIGVAVAQGTGAIDADALIESADRRLYAAKAAGRDQIVGVDAAADAAAADAAAVAETTDAAATTAANDAAASDTAP